MKERAVNHVRHGFESPVWMPGRTFWFAGSVVDFTHLIHVNEWVKFFKCGALECAMYRESLALNTTGGR